LYFINKLSDTANNECDKAVQNNCCNKFHNYKLKY
jgi:hypothetical protein